MRIWSRHTGVIQTDTLGLRAEHLWKQDKQSFYKELQECTFGANGYFTGALPEVQ